MSYNLQNLNNIEELNKLSPEEREIVFSLFTELVEKGSSKQFTDLMYADYEEVPVTIDEFLDNPQYLGKGLLAEGKSTVFPYWREMLRKIFPDNVSTDYNTLVLSGAIGLGKSFVAVICILYLLYRMICLKERYLHYGLQPIDKITFSFINITMDAAKGVAWSKCQELLQSSPWFMSKGSLTKSQQNPEWVPPKGLELIYGSQPRHVIGRAVFASFEDEVSFQPNQDVNKQKGKAKRLINSIDARMKSRFMKGERLPTLHILASSKRTEQSFLETYIETKRKNESKTTLIIDEPQWVIRTDKDSPRKFKVAVGSKFLTSEVLPLNVSDEEVQIYRNRGFQIIDVPMGYYENFIDDIDVALTDIAGISTSSSNRYFSGPRIATVLKKDYKNLFIREVIEVGNGPEDLAQYYDFIDLSRLSPEMKSKPLYIHIDMSASGDKTGLAGVWIKGKKPPQPNVPQSNDLFYKAAFAVSVKAPKGHQISFEKNRQFIYWLREQGFNIKAVSTDTYQSVDTGQALAARGYNYSVISVDRVDTDHICKPYQYLRSTIYEQRIELFEDKLLQEELLGLERDNNSGKIDHSPSGINSKDKSDAICGAIWRASQDAEKYAQDYGETLTTITQVSGANAAEMDRKQLQVAFEEEMQKVFGEKARTASNSANARPQAAITENPYYPRPSQSRATSIENLAYLQNGIIIW